MHLEIELPRIETNYPVEENVIHKLVRTFYVDTVNGNDSSDGSWEYPWEDPEYAAMQLMPGDLLYVKEGNYRHRGTFEIRNLHGTPEAPIAIVGIDQPLFTRILLVNCSFVYVANFSVVGPHKLPEGWMEMPFVNRDPSIEIDSTLAYWRRRRKINRKYPKYMEIMSWEGSDSYNGGIEMVSCSRCTFDKCSVALCTYGAKVSQGTIFSAIVNCTLQKNLVGIYCQYAGNEAFSAYKCLFYNNRIYHSYRDGILLSSMADSNYVYDNTITYSGIGQIATYGAGSFNKIYNNVVSYSGYYAETMRAPGASAISIHSSGQDNVVHGNIVSWQKDDTLRDGNGIIVDHTRERTFVVNNLVFKCIGSGVALVDAYGAVVSYNTLVNCGPWNFSFITAGIRSSTETDYDHTISSNIIYNCNPAGIALANTRFVQQRVIDNSVYSPMNSGYYYYAEEATGARAYDVYGKDEEPEAVRGTLYSEPSFSDANSQDYSMAVPIASPLAPITVNLDLENKERAEIVRGAFG